MGLPVVVGVGTFASGISSVSPGIPAGMAAGDIMFLGIETANEAVPATPSGWTLPSAAGHEDWAAIGTTRTTWFYRMWQSGDSAPATGDSGNHQCAQIIGIRNADSTTLGFSVGQTHAFAILGAYTLTTTVLAGDMMVALAGTDYDGNSTSVFSITNPGSYSNATIQAQKTVNTAAGGGLAIVTAEALSAGTNSLDLACPITDGAAIILRVRSNVPLVAPTITSDIPTTKELAEGAGITLSVSANGSPAPTYQWKVSTNSGGVWSDMSGMTSSFLTYAVALADNGNWYKCTATNSQGSVDSSVCVLTVTANFNLMYSTADMTTGDWDYLDYFNVTATTLYFDERANNRIYQTVPVTPGQVLSLCFSASAIDTSDSTGHYEIVDLSNGNTVIDSGSYVALANAET